MDLSYKVSKILDGIDDKTLLKEIAEEALKRVEKRIISLHRKRKKCSKLECKCSLGPVETHGHGPYVYAVYRDRFGDQKHTSLGRFMDASDFEDLRQQLRDGPPKWHEFRIDKKLYDKEKEKFEELWRLNDAYQRQHGEPMPDMPQQKYGYARLTEDEFLERYGIPVEENRLNAPLDIAYSIEKFKKASKKYDDIYDRLYSGFEKYGIGASVRNIEKLRNLLDSGQYHLVEPQYIYEVLDA